MALGEYGVQFHFTNACDLSCGHCYHAAEKGGATMPLADIERTFSHFPKGLKKMVVTGGEPFLRPKELDLILSLVAAHQASVTVQTNGAWACAPDGEERAYATMRRMYDLGLGKELSGILWSGNDRWHEAQSVDLALLSDEERSPFHRATRRLFNETKWAEGVITFGTAGAKQGLLPLGRARRLPAKLYGTRSQCYAFTDGERLTVTIDPAGEVFPCPWEATPSMGSILERRLDLLVKHALHRPLFSALKLHGPYGAAVELGEITAFDARAVDLIQHPCGGCLDLFQQRIDYFGGA